MSIVFILLSACIIFGTSKVCVVDGYSIPISMLKHRKELEIIQIWHSSGAIKKFGFQSLNKKEGRGLGVAKVMNMHKNYSHVLAPSNQTKKFYKEAFGVEEDKVVMGLLPRIDYIRKEDRIKEKFLSDYPEKENKKTILYVPTFRKDEQLDLSDLEKNINTSKYNLIIQLHPLDKTKVNEKFTVNRTYNTFDLLKISDYIITDYSAVAFESSILNKPVYFYVNDIDQYIKNRGLNVDLFKEMPHATSNTK